MTEPSPLDPGEVYAEVPEDDLGEPLDAGVPHDGPGAFAPEDEA